MSYSFNPSRRLFLRDAVCSSLAAATSGALMTQFGLVNSALAQSSCGSYGSVGDYKALVCLFLLGGNDSWNMLIPSDATRYATYSASRSGAAPTGMAIAQNTLLPINVLNAAAGEAYGLHPNLSELARLFNNGSGAFVVNVGTALQPTVKTQYLKPGYPLPPQLFSHADQQAQWQYGQPKQNGTTLQSHSSGIPFLMACLRCRSRPSWYPAAARQASLFVQAPHECLKLHFHELPEFQFLHADRFAQAVGYFPVLAEVLAVALTSTVVTDEWPAATGES